MYPNIPSHTGGYMSMGYVMIHCHSRNKKLITKITTKSELIGTSEYVPFNIWIVMLYDTKGV